MFVNTVEVLWVEIVSLSGGYGKRRASIVHHQPHVGRDEDCGGGITTIDVKHTVMNLWADAKGMKGFMKACDFCRRQGRLMEKTLSWYKRHIETHVGTFFRK